MKISTNQFFDQASRQILTTQQRLGQVQTQLATGKKINSASDAPSQASTLQRLRSLIGEQENYQKNLGSLQDRLQAQDTALRNASSMVIRLHELAVQYASDTMSAGQRAAAATEVSGLRDQLLSLANSRDSDGNSLFGGSRVARDAFAADGAYQGDQTSNAVPVGDSRMVSSRRTGSDVFISLLRTDSTAEPATQASVGFFESIDDLASALQTNQSSGIQRGIGEMAALLQGVTVAQADIGSNLNIAESQGTVLDENLLRLRSLQSDMRDLDYTEAVTRMQQEMLALQAAQSSFAQISKLSLFNYIN